MAVTVLRHAGALAVVEAPGRVPLGFALAVRPPRDLVFLLEPRAPLTAERETAIRDLADGTAQVAAVDDRFAFVGVAGSLGVTLADLLERVGRDGGALDALLVAYVGHAVARAVADVNATCDASAGRISAPHVWLSWDGAVHLAGPLHRALVASVPELERRDDVDRDGHELAALFLRLAHGVAELPPAVRALVDGEHAPAHARDVLGALAREREQEAQALLAGTLASFFRDERKRELEWQDELAIEDITEVNIDARGPTLRAFVDAALPFDVNGVPMLVTDLVPRSVLVALHTEHGSTLFAPFAERWAPTPEAAREVSHAIAGAAAAAVHRHTVVASAALDDVPAWRLPTDAEWSRLAEGGGVGVPSTCGARGFGRVWEWTSTPHERGGFVVRGGRWRNRRLLPRVTNRSSEDGAAPDVGFRLVRYVNLADVPQPFVGPYDDDDDGWMEKT